MFNNSFESSVSLCFWGLMLPWPTCLLLLVLLSGQLHGFPLLLLRQILGGWTWLPLLCLLLVLLGLLLVLLGLLSFDLPVNCLVDCPTSLVTLTGLAASAGALVLIFTSEIDVYF